MNGKHATTISLAVGLAAVAGTIAATRTVHLARPVATQPAAASTSIVERSRQLDRAEASLRRALSQKPPKLPPLPAAATAGTAPAAAAQPRVVYRRPAPIIRHVHRAGGEHEGELEAAPGSERGGGGFDD